MGVFLIETIGNLESDSAGSVYGDVLERNFTSTIPRPNVMAFIPFIDGIREVEKLKEIIPAAREKYPRVLHFSVRIYDGCGNLFEL